MNSAGSVGMITFHITNSPVSGATISSAATATPATRLPARIACHTLTGMRLGICV